jgi:hypothetical protein
MDKFEQFFKENRLKLDVEPLSELFQEKLAAELKARKKRIQLNSWMAAAGIALLFIAGSLINRVNHQTTQLSDTLSNSNQLTQQASLINPYQSEIETSVQLISQQAVPSEYLTLFQAFILQLQIIDKQEAIYLKILEKYGYTEEMIQQIQYNYELKLLVLQKLQNEIKKINHLTKNKHHVYEKITLTL